MTQGQIAYKKRFGLRKYEVISAPKNIVEHWKKDISEVRQVIAAGHRAEITQCLTKDDSIRIDIDSNMEFLETLGNGNTHKNVFTLVAIGLWVLREKSVWKGNFRAGLKFALGGRYPMQSFVERNGNATCLDVCVLINEMTRALNIAGGVYTFGGGIFNHRFWISDRNTVLDPMFASKRGGYFGTVDEFREYLLREKFPRYIKRTVQFDLVRETATDASR